MSRGLKTFLLGACALLAIATTAQATSRFHALTAFTGPNGAEPGAAPVIDADGNLYGTTQFGGSANLGTVYKRAPDGTLTVLTDFAAGGGSRPSTTLLRDAQGNLFGVTPYDAAGQPGGTLFEIASDGGFHVLYTFVAKSKLGAAPWGGLIEDEQGNLYGTTAKAVFRFTPGGAMTILHHFSLGNGDGTFPVGELLRDGAGNLYGATARGGAYDGGTVYKLTPGGTETLLHEFDLRAHQTGSPKGGLVLDAAGNLYGTTFIGDDNPGSAFKLAPDGTYTILHDFSGGSDGESPIGTLAKDANGHLFGMTSAGGGARECGTVFQVAPDGRFWTLYRFNDGTTHGARHGCQPEAGLTIDAAGNLYGTTAQAGVARGHRAQGVLFRIDAR